MSTHFEYVEDRILSIGRGMWCMYAVGGVQSRVPCIVDSRFND